MITEEQIKERITKLTAEQSVVELQHQKLLSDHQQRTQQVQQVASANLNRIEQIRGAIAQLKELLNGEQPTEGKPQ